MRVDWPGHGHVWIAYATALALPPTVLLVRAALGTSVDQPLLLLFLVPIVGGALLGGLWPGLLATAASALLAKYYPLPPLHRWPQLSDDNIELLSFLVTLGIFSSALIELARRQQARLRQAWQAAEVRRAVPSGFSSARHAALSSDSPVGGPAWSQSMLGRCGSRIGCRQNPCVRDGTQPVNSGNRRRTSTF